VTKRLDSIDGKLAGLLVRIGRIEKALGIEPPKVEVPKGSAPSEDKRPGEGGREQGQRRGQLLAVMTAGSVQISAVAPTSQAETSEYDPRFCPLPYGRGL